MTATGLEAIINYFVNENSTISPKCRDDWAVFWVLICKVNLTVCSCHVTYPFQDESTLYSCLNIKELFAQSMREMWNLSYCNWTGTQNHLVCKWTMNHLAKLSEYLSCVLSIYLYGAFDSIFLHCHVGVSEWIQTLQFRECQETHCL